MAAHTEKKEDKGKDVNEEEMEVWECGKKTKRKI